MNSFKNAYDYLLNLKSQEFPPCSNTSTKTFI